MFNLMQTIGEKLEKSSTSIGIADHKSEHDKSEEFWRDYYLAGESITPAEKLAALAEHIDPIIRKRVAENLQLPAYVQRILASDQSVDVRLALTANPSTLIEIWAQLAEDDSEIVRFSVARNKNMPVPMLINLARDEQINIAGQAQRTIEEIFGGARLSAA